MAFFRNGLKAIIVEDGKLLTLKMEGDRGDTYYALPGGGQEEGEDFLTALRRECQEEISCDVVPHDLLFVREYIGANHEFADQDSDVHQINMMFRCELAQDTRPRLGESGDLGQVGVEWIPLIELPQRPFYPRAMRQLLAEVEGPGPRPVYLGDIN